MDTRTPNAAKRAAKRATRPRVVRASRKSGAERLRELDSILRDIDVTLRKKGMTASDRRELRKWIANG